MASCAFSSEYGALQAPSGWNSAAVGSSKLNFGLLDRSEMDPRTDRWRLPWFLVNVLSMYIGRYVVPT